MELTDSSIEYKMNRTFKLIMHVVIFIGFISVFMGFYFWEQNIEREKLGLYIEASFKDSIKSGNIYQNAKDIYAIESLGLINCVILSSEDFHQPFYISSDFSKCGVKAWAEFFGANGVLWKVQYSVPLNTLKLIFYLLAAVGTATVFSLIVEFLRGQINRIERETILKRTENEMLKNLTQQARHDVASPLSAIKVAAKLPGIDDKIRTLLEMAIERTEEIVESMKIDSQEVGVEQLHLAKVIENIITEKKVEHPATKIQFEALERDIKIFADEPNLKRLLSNLFNNSIEAGATEIQVGIEKEEGNLIILKVEDNGSGLPPEMFFKAFDKGFSYKKGKGTGLGLFHAKTKIESWGGKITISRPASLRGLLVEVALKAA